MDWLSLMGIPRTGPRGALTIIVAALAVCTVAGVDTASHGNRTPPAPQHGTLSVTIRSGAAARPPLRVTVDASICGATVPDESVVIAGGRVANAVVSLPGLPGTHAATLEIENDKCRFAPHVALAAPGATMKMVSRDPTLHTVHAHQAGRSLFNVGLPIPGLTISRPAPASGVVALKCNTHPWMSGYVVVTSARAAVSHADGTARFDHVPAGMHAIAVWHEALGAGSAEVAVAAGAHAAVEITLAK